MTNGALRNLLTTEIRRCFARRLVWVLLALAVVGCALTAVLVWANNERPAAGTAARYDAEYRGAVAACVAEAGPGAEARCERSVRPPDDGQLHYRKLWVEGDDSFLGAAGIFLLMGALIGGASMVGAEWRAGTVTTLLTWEPRRARVVAAKTLAPGLVAAFLAFVLLTLFSLALLPAALTRGTMEGTDGAWLVAALGAALRISAACGLVAAFGAALAMLGRNTATALGVAFAYFTILENLIQAWKPWTARFLVGPNGGIFVTANDLLTEDFTRSTVTAALTLAAYLTVAIVAAAMVLRRRDLSGVS